MRLIDADTLHISFDGHTVSVWKKDLDAAPTINPYEWISVDDRLPEPFVSVLVFRNGKISIDYHEENGWFAYDFEEKRATHWMPLPTPPTETEN